MMKYLVKRPQPEEGVPAATSSAGSKRPRENAGAQSAAPASPARAAAPSAAPASPARAAAPSAGGATAAASPRSPKRVRALEGAGAAPAPSAAIAPAADAAADALAASLGIDRSWGAVVLAETKKPYWPSLQEFVASRRARGAV
jgi:uracil-DNA glycosylase